MFINISNHPIAGWSQKQKDSAGKYGELVDLDFPYVDPWSDEDDICNLANEYLERTHILLPPPGKSSAIHLAGEPTFVFQLATLLKQDGYTVLTSTTEREVIEKDNKKISIFNFIKFRKYGKDF